MLQKVLVVIMGLVMSVVGALSPDALFASKDGHADQFLANTAEEMLSTLRTSDGRAFARVSVLWVEVDGHRVGEDAWGTGSVDEIKFKVGVKDVTDLALAVGDKVVDLHPTDIITIRMFRGDFSYRGMGTGLASVQLQGTVKTTAVSEGDVSNRVVTQVSNLDLAGVRKGDAPTDDGKVAFVVLTTGQKVDTVAVEDGGSRLFTQDADVAADATAEPGNLLAKWVKIDNKLVREYTWGDGSIKKIEFEPAEAVTRSVVLEFNGEVSEVAAGERVIIQDFVGEYLIYQVSGGMMRVRLDGYAAVFDTRAAITLPTIGGAGAPFANFNFTPVSPKTTDTVRFADISEDDGGIIVFRQWDFGDGTMASPLEQPTHRYATPGTYTVNLTVTDNDLQASTLTRVIIVRNAEPVPDFDFSPKVVTTATVVAFTDASFDSDGNITSFQWDFGDGDTSNSRNPSHRFLAGKNYTVTLTATDERGGRESLSKVVIVRNSPPLARFTFSPGAPLTSDPVQFVDASNDTDGTLVNWNWSFGDGTFGSGSAPTHGFPRPGVFTVSLRATDNSGDSASASVNIMVGNRPPYADFVWNPVDQPANVPITFASTSTDPDGQVVLNEWNFGDGSTNARGTTTSHVFPRAGSYLVTLTSTDNSLGTSQVARTINVSNSAPRANFAINPSPAFRQMAVTFADSSTDPDGDAIVNWTWDLGDGSIAYGRVVSHSYLTVGPKAVTLIVRDAANTQATVTRSLQVLNRPPTVVADFTPRLPAAGQDILFTANGIDPDSNGALIFEWIFNDGPRYNTSQVTRNYTHAGNYSVYVRSRDVDGGVSQPIVFGIRVIHATPQVGFDILPLVPVKDQLVQFSDRTIPAPDAVIREWRWNFGASATSTSADRNPKFAYTRNGTYNVTLEVVDVNGMVNSTTRELFVNLAPESRFTMPTGIIRLNAPVHFTDASIDEDGEVREWAWSFGDGTVDHNRTPADHTYSIPGAYIVGLTVRDDRGASTTRTKTLNVEDTPPLAAWNFTTLTQPQERGVPFYFYGGALSSDPDGQPLTSFTWDFGDVSPLVQAANTSHIFTTSGFKTVGLTVSDGIKSSPRTSDSHQRVLVGASHAVKLHVTATLPGDRVADLSSASYTIRVRLSNAPTVDLPASAIVVNGTGVDVTIDKGLWVNGVKATLRISAPFLITTEEQTVTLTDGTLDHFVPFALRMTLRATVVPNYGANPSVLACALGCANTTANGDPIYKDMSEKPFGTGTLIFADGTPAGITSVVVEARWVPIRGLLAVRDTQQVATATSGGILGWCPVASVTTAFNGTFQWAFDGQSTCVTNNVLGVAAYPVGRWEVRARPSLDLDSLSPSRAIYVDPTGGFLVSNSGGLV